MHDLVIRNATIVDGSGGPSYQGDVAIDGESIASVGFKARPGKREIDAAGRLVTPGWVDIHTHYDAQATWDPYLSPSSWHGVTSVVMGNCGVGFAPVAPDKHDWLIGLMEGVEDIPGAAMAEGIRWGWESFPEYLDVLEGMPRAIDIGTQVPHGALRVYVMGERGARNEPATADDIARMSALVQAGLEAGALGFSTSRTLIHRSKDGELVPGTFAERDELFGIGRALARAGAGVFQLTTNHGDMAEEFVWMRDLAAEIDRPVTFNLVQIDEKPELWQRMLGLVEQAAADGIPVIAQVAGRPAGVLQGWQCTAHPFVAFPAWQAMAALPWTERLERLRDPEVRRRILGDKPVDLGPFGNFITRSFGKMFPLGDPPDYEPSADKSLAAIAARTGTSPLELAYDLMLESDGRGLLYFPLFNYSGGHMEPLREMQLHPRTRISLGDGGAHCGAICDASIPTYMLSYWVRDRARGPRLPLELVVRRQTWDTARLYGLLDRGVLAPGMKADLNVIDLAGLHLNAPEMVFDLPAGGRRLIQRVNGYQATIVSGQVIYEDGVATGAMPGRLLRGAQRAP